MAVNLQLSKFKQKYNLVDYIKQGNLKNRINIYKL